MRAIGFPASPYAPPARLLGVVCWYNAGKGFGFIETDDGDAAIFVHASNVEGDEPLQIGDRVSFTVRNRSKGPSAETVRREGI